MNPASPIDHAYDERGAAHAPHSAIAGGEMPLVALAAAIWRARRMVLLVMLASVAITVSVGLLLPRTYTVRASFLPQSRKLPSNLSGLASQFGLNLPLSDAGQSPQFYADLLHTHEILAAVNDTRFVVRTAAGPREGSLDSFYQIREKSRPLRREAAIRKLDKDLKTAVSSKTNVVELTVVSRFPDLSAQIAQRAVDLVDAFNRETRQSQGSAERKFAEQRVAEARVALRRAEDRLQSFLQQNREYRAPALQFEQERLARDVSQTQTLYSTLLQAYEQAKMEEIRDTPVITTIERPERPVEPDSRRLALKAALAALAGLAFGALAAIMGALRPAPAATRLAASGAGARADEPEELRSPVRPPRALGGSAPA